MEDNEHGTKILDKRQSLTEPRTEITEEKPSCGNNDQKVRQKKIHRSSMNACV